MSRGAEGSLERRHIYIVDSVMLHMISLMGEVDGGGWGGGKRLGEGVCEGE